MARKDTKTYSDANTERWADPEYRARLSASISASLKRVCNTPEGRARMSATSSRPKPLIGVANKRRWKSPEWRERFAALRKAKASQDPRCAKCGRLDRGHVKLCPMCGEPVCSRSGEACSKSCAGKLRVQRNPLWTEQLKTLAVGTKRDPEAYRRGAAKRLATPGYRDRLREASKRRSADPEFRRKVSEGLRAVLVLPAAKRRRSRLSKRFWKDPTYREKQRIAGEVRAGALRLKWKTDAAFRARMREVSSRTAIAVNRSRGRYEYLDRHGMIHRFKSGDAYERGFARWLDAIGLAWDYEPVTILLSDGRRYTPDFRVQEFGGFVEVKGRAVGLDKVELALELGHKVFVLHGLGDLPEFQRLLGVASVGVFP